MRVRRSIVAVPLVAIAASALVHAAFAQQPRGKHGKPKPAPTTTSADAGASDNPYAEDNANGAAPSPSASPASSSGPVPAPIAPPSAIDGGVKPSPLNPAPNELPPQTAAPMPDYDKLIGDVAALRARVAAVTDTLFRSRIALSLEADGAHAKTSRLVVSLDDGVVFTAQPGANFESAQAIYEHGVAPGRHAVTIDVDRKDDRDETYRTSQRSRFLVDVPQDQRLEVKIAIDDDSNIAGDFASDRKGRYDLRVRANAKAKPVR